MKVGPATDSILDALSAEDPLDRSDAVEAASDALRSGILNRREAEAVSRELVQLARDSSWEVRLAVAHASVYLPRQKAFEAVMEWLTDASQREFVRDAANRAIKLRATITRPDLVGGMYAEELVRSVAVLERDHGRGARRAAEVLAHRIAGLIVRDLRHEISNVLAPVEDQIDRLLKGAHDASREIK